MILPSDAILSICTAPFMPSAVSPLIAQLAPSPCSIPARTFGRHLISYLCDHFAYCIAPFASSPPRNSIREILAATLNSVCPGETIRFARAIVSSTPFLPLHSVCRRPRRDAVRRTCCSCSDPPGSLSLSPLFAFISHHLHSLYNRPVSSSFLGMYHMRANNWICIRPGCLCQEL